MGLRGGIGAVFCPDEGGWRLLFLSSGPKSAFLAPFEVVPEPLYAYYSLEAVESELALVSGKVYE